jgi:hypothetical protein
VRVVGLKSLTMYHLKIAPFRLEISAQPYAVTVAIERPSTVETRPEAPHHQWPLSEVLGGYREICRFQSSQCISRACLTVRSRPSIRMPRITCFWTELLSFRSRAHALALRQIMLRCSPSIARTAQANQIRGLDERAVGAGNSGLSIGAMGREMASEPYILKPIVLCSALPELASRAEIQSLPGP